MVAKKLTFWCTVPELYWCVVVPLLRTLEDLARDPPVPHLPPSGAPQVGLRHHALVLGVDAAVVKGVVLPVHLVPHT